MELAAGALIVLLCHQAAAAAAAAGTIPPHREPAATDELDVYKYHVQSEIRFRYASTVISCSIMNPANFSQQRQFNIDIPEAALVSGLLMDIDGQVYRADVREKDTSSGEVDEVANLSLSARNSNQFTVSVNVEPHKKVTFNLTYEELLSRKLGTYKHVMNLDPGQIVRDLSVEVRIQESSDIGSVNVPAPRTSSKMQWTHREGISSRQAMIQRPARNVAVVVFSLSPEQQRSVSTKGLQEQFIVEYDLQDIEATNDVLVNESYFVHFFAPPDLPPLRKHVTFLLDVSSAMDGRSIQQLKEAMTFILDNLHVDDLVSILTFSNNVKIWNYVLNQNMKQESSTSKLNAVLTSNVAAKATPVNIAKAKEFVQRLTAHGESNIHDALLKALATSRLHMGRSADNEVFESILVFLTAGKPSMGITDTHTIVPSVSKANAGQTCVFSLELGNDDTVDFAFLEKLSSTNLGFAQKVQSSSDTAEQFRAFYRQFESPVLADISFKYQPKQFVPASLTTHTFRRTFSGSELVVAGQLLGEDIDGEVQGRTSQGSLSYPFIPMYFTTTDGMTRKTTKTTSNTFQRIWEYLSVRQLLQDCSKQDKRRTLSLAKEYSFVTPMTSLVMKSRGSNYVKIKNTSPSMDQWCP
ncbi:inter-alpha-trypsin inhibitor heavy chain H5-like [Periplaneta americana]|uniref:inter-alpha-trypsin inhibitor heavy chain H5-like n=1 Tax=Periplaneta americana TaxID=6978 RepID=UPI0037E93BC6